MNLLTRGLLCAIHMRFDDRLQIEDKAYINEFGEPDFERETQKFNRRLRAIENLRKSDDQLERERIQELEMAKRKGVIDHDLFSQGTEAYGRSQGHKRVSRVVGHALGMEN